MNKVIFLNRNNKLVCRENQSNATGAIHYSDIIHLIKYFQLYNIPYILHLEKESIGCISSPWVKLLEKQLSYEFKPMRPLQLEDVYEITVKLTGEQYQLIRKKFDHMNIVALKGMEEGYQLFNDVWSKEEVIC